MANTDVKITLSASDKTQAAFRSTENSLTRLSSKASGLASKIGAFTGALTVTALGAFAKNTLDTADGLAKMSLRTGVATKDLASFKLAADSADTSMEGVAKGLGKLNRSIGEAENGNKLIAASLKELGITAKDPKEAFFQLADATKRIQDPTKRAYLLNNVLGKSYEELVPLLVQGGDALRQSASDSESFADAMARLAPEAEKFNDQLTQLKINAAGAAASILGPLVGSFNEYIAVMQEVISTGSILDKVRFFALGNASDEIVGKVRAAAKASADAAKAAREAAAKGGAGTIKPIATGSRTAKRSDPLASLLASTDIGRLAAFDKQVALLNTRFDGGRKNAELYSQAMTKLVESTFSANFSDFNKQLADQDETQKLVAEHLKSTNDALYEQQQAWVDAGKSLEDEMRTPLENANLEFGRLQDLLDRGVISWETYTRAVFKTQESIASVPKALQEMDTFAKTAAKNIQNSFSDFFKSSDKGFKGMAQSFGQMLQNMIADAVAADLTRKLFGAAAEGGSGSGLFGGALDALGGILFSHANGGIMTSAGPMPLNTYASGGIANSPQLALFGEGRMNEAYVPLPDGRNIPVKMQGGGGNTYITNVYGTNNAPDVRRAAGQGMREAIGFMNGARRYG